MVPERRYWFPAKRYGWGWGLPIAWQGWLALAVLLGLIVVDAFFVLPCYGLLMFYVLAVFLVAFFVLVCWYTGEPLRWRWGGK